MFVGSNPKKPQLPNRCGSRGGFSADFESSISKEIPAFLNKALDFPKQNYFCEPKEGLVVEGPEEDDPAHIPILLFQVLHGVGDASPLPFP